MNETTRPITDDDLHGYADGQLSPQRRAVVEAYLHENTEAAQLVRSYVQINQGLHALFDEPASEPAVEDFHPAVRRLSNAWRMAAAGVVMAVGFAAGWLGHVIADDATSPVMVDLVSPAAFAHVVFTTDKTHPVEIDSEQAEHLETWLSNRLDTPLQAPDLGTQGFRLLGGRLLPSTGRMAAQFMYENEQGLRVTLYQRKGEWGRNDNAFGYAFYDGVGVLFWTEGQMGYALSGALDRSRILKLADAMRGLKAPPARHF